jgi:5-(carboxyamino)imidazole ribonucleotide mutase
MPAGIPVATVALDGAENAALLAVQILAVEDLRLREALHKFRDELEDRVEVKNKALRKRIES